MLNSSDVAIIGAGPYGLSIAAHLLASDIEHRIIGDPMQFWLKHMPNGMLLKSDGFASTLYDPGGDFTLRQYCEEHNIEYADLGTPVHLEDFCAYGLAFQQRFAPHLDNQKVTSLERTGTQFTLHLSNGESFTAQRVIVATGLSYFEHVPSELVALPKDLLSHSSAHVDLSRLRGRDVTVIGGGASATELATLLYEAGSIVRMVARNPSVLLHKRMPDSRTLAKQFDGRCRRSGPDGSRASLRTCRSYSTTCRSRCKKNSSRAFSGPLVAGSCAGALTMSRFWLGIRSKEPKRSVTEPSFGSSLAMAIRGKSRPSTSLRRPGTAPM